MNQLVIYIIALLVNLALCGVYDDPQTLKNRQAMVHLFEWTWPDIANECENFLQHYGYGAVQISPPQEHIVLESQGDRPWWIRYQPISYHLVSRSGTRAQFIDMVQRCNAVGVRIVADAVINHMAGVGQKWGVNGVGDTENSTFCACDKAENFPKVPYTAAHFHDPECDHDIQNWSDKTEVWTCRLVGLLDLDQSQPYVQKKIAGYLSDMIDIGVAGFRVDAEKSIDPNQCAAIYYQLHPLRPDVFGAGAKPFIVGEVAQGPGGFEHMYTGVGRITNFAYGQKLACAAKREYPHFSDFTDLGAGTFGLADTDALNFIDNHDSQRNLVPLTYHDGQKYALAVGFMLAHNYGYPRVMSSYYFNGGQFTKGPPSTGAPQFKTTSPYFNSDGTCNAKSGWVCEHRWPSIRAMALFHSVVAGEGIGNFATATDAIAFSRGNKGFFAVNNNDAPWNNRFQTDLPAGTYTDAISGTTRITVDSSGSAQISVPAVNMIAIHVGQVTPPVTFPTAIPTYKTPDMSTLSTNNVPTHPPTGSPATRGFQKTVIFLHRPTQSGQDVFIRGGIGLSSPFGKELNCPNDNRQLSSNKCALPIQHTTKVPSNFETYIDWSQGDNYLDWYGAEPGQGVYNGQIAQGSPLAWSTNTKNQLGYQPLNHYGSNYWIVALIINCTNSDNGWFEFKGYMTNGLGWEPDMSQITCGGSIGGTVPYHSKNHMARCGNVNVFSWGSSSCAINGFS